MNTFDDPVKTSNIGGRPQHVGLSPMSPQRAAGLPLISTDTQAPSMIGPTGGNGVGGTGGGPLGGWSVCACGSPIVSERMVAAGNAGSACAIALVALAKPSLSRLIGCIGAATTAPIPFEIVCSALVGRA